VFSATGNHEEVPTDNFPPRGVPEKFSHDWLYEAFAENWGKWLPADTLETIKWRASYMVRPYNGLRIISLNTIYAYDANFWLKLNQTDPDGTLSWFLEQLADAERSGEKVWIIAHVYNDAAMNSWSKIYYDAVNRYENTIRGQFFGHSHSDELRIHYESMTPNSRATSVEYIGPSITTYSTRMPSYRMYTIEGEHDCSTWSVLDHATYKLDLNKANKPNATPTWELEYTAKAAYGLPSLTPNDWDELTLRMEKNITLVQMYRTFVDRNPPGDCDEKCVHDTICDIRTAINGYNSFCNSTKSHDPYKTNTAPVTRVHRTQLNDVVKSIEKMKLVSAGVCKAKKSEL